jgi:transposase InsO family protein
MSVMRIAVAVIALFVFAALLVMDTGAILSLAFSWAIGGPAYRWILLGALIAVVALYLCRQIGPHASGRARARTTRSPRQPGASRFATLECELLDRRRFMSQAEARMACFSFIEGWYNPVRLHSALGYQSPIAYELAMDAVTTKP